jgi:dephospho-CoA kinase
MTVIGLTGGFGTGKSTVAAMFKALGAAVLDADRIAHRALAKGTTTYRRILKMFGAGIVKKNGDIDRRRLGAAAFRNKRLLAGLCGIIHPFVIRYMKAAAGRVKRQRPTAVVILDAPLLIEAGLLGMVDKVIVVKAKVPVQVARCRKKTGLSMGEISARIGAQLPINRKIRFSDFVIDNNGTKRETKREVKRVWERIRRQTVR